MVRSVAIVGAGPAGLVAAKTLLQYEHGSAFEVTVFEKHHRLGGLWALDEDSTNEGFLSAHTPTNLSKYTVGFSDLSWDSIDLTPRERLAAVNGHHKTNGDEHDAGNGVPMFPKAWQAGRYLEQYANRYIPESVIRYSCAVVKTERIEHDGRERWKVTISTMDEHNSDKTSHEARTFNHLIVASGFFSQPRSLPQELSPVQTDPAHAVKIIHSSQYRGLGDLFHDGLDYKGKKILLVGGGNSAGEVAGTVAFHLSSAKYSSSQSASRFEDCKIHHVTPRPLYALPPFVPGGNDKTGFVPIDVKLYDLAARPPGEISSKSGRLPEDFIPVIHGAIQSMVGGDQSDLGDEAATVKKDDQKRAPYVALSESYPEYVRAGDIYPKLGRLVQLELEEGQEAVASPRTLRAIIDQQGETFEITDVVAVIHATGYTPSTALDYLPKDVKQALEYDPATFRLPLLLDQQQTMSKAVPDLAFIGFYEGPYWGVMEMQARLVARRWTGALSKVQRPSEDLEKMRDLRKAMEDRKKDVPQYWLGDYLGYMEELSRELHLNRNDHPFKPREGIVTPARYLNESSNKPEAAKMMDSLNRTLLDSSHGAYTSRAAFRAMQGRWQIYRRLSSAIPSFPSGTFEGTACFHPRVPSTNPDSTTEDVYDFEYLYIESGTFITDTGATLSASRRYVYRFRETNDRISVWFVKEDGYEVDYLFQELELSHEESPRPKEHAVAIAEHLCINDLYRTRYVFEFRGISLDNFKIVHTVKGPSKDYVSTTDLKR